MVKGPGEVGSETTFDIQRCVLEVAGRCLAIHGNSWLAQVEVARLCNAESPTIVPLDQTTSECFFRPTHENLRTSLRVEHIGPL